MLVREEREPRRHEVVGSAPQRVTARPHLDERSVVVALDRGGHGRVEQLGTTAGAAHPVALHERLDRHRPPRRRHERARRQALIGVSDHADVVVGLAEHEHDLVLRAVRVLVLVDEHVLEALLVVRQHVGMLTEQLHREREDVVEVERAGALQTDLILAVDVGDTPFEDRRRLGRVLLGADRARSWPR